MLERTQGSVLEPARLSRRAPVFILCSPRPRVGCTLIARLLIEFFLLDGRRVAGFDVNPLDPALAQRMPDHVRAASIADTRSQMALFDRLIANDGVPKVVDLAHGLFDPFFGLARQIGFMDEARARLIDPVALFVTDTHRLSVEAYEMLLSRFPRLVLVPVHNEAITSAYYEESFPILRANGAPLRIPRLSPALNAVINRDGFSFVDFLRKRVAHATELHDFANRSFVAFRELELRLMMQDFRLLFQPRA